MVADPKPKKGNVSSLSKALGVSRQTIYTWRQKLGFKCPDMGDVEAWKATLEKEGLGIANNQNISSRDSLLQERIKRETRLLDIKIAEAERKKVDREEVNQLLRKVATSQRALLFQILGRELGARCVGKTATEINLVGKQIALRLCEVFQQESDSWLSE